MSRRSVRVLAPAKVNLFLGVHNQLDERGYHRVDSLMACVDVAEVVTIHEADRLSVTCTPDVGVPQEQNTCWRAACGMGEAFGREAEFRILVEKRVPDRAGLGGSSSDAAATIRGICQLWDIDPADPRCADVARAVGADVAFFLLGAPAFLEGAGDVACETFPAIQGAHLALVKPAQDNAGIDTGKAYAEFDREPVPAGNAEPLRAALREGSWERARTLLENNLEPVAMRLSPRVAELRAWLGGRTGVVRAMVTGSGSCVFAACESAEAAARIADEARGLGMWAHAGGFAQNGVSLV